MFRLGASTSTQAMVERSLAERISCASYAAMGYWFYRWDWGESIAMDGLMAAGKKLGNRAFTDFVVAGTLAWMRAAVQEGACDPMGPAGALLDALDSKLIDDPASAESLLAALAESILSTGAEVGGLSPHGSDDMLFVDALYGYPALLARLGRRSGDDRLVHGSVELVLRHCRALQDAQTGLFAHVAAVSASGPDVAAEAGSSGSASTGRVPWGRGNGWAALGLSDLLVALPPDSAGVEPLREIFLAQLRGLRTLQTPGGYWRNIVDQEASYPESSTTAMVETAISQAVRAGIIDPSFQPMADAAWLAIEHRIDTNGHLIGVSYRPGVNADPRRYEHTPAVGAYPWGQGAFLRSACQRMPSEHAKGGDLHNRNTPGTTTTER